MENKNRTLRSILIFLSLPLFIILGFIMINGILPEKTYDYSEIVEHFKKHEVTEYDMNLGSGDMNIKLESGEQIHYTAPSVNLIYEDIKGYINEYNAENPDKPMVYNLIKPADTSWLTSLFGAIVLPVIIICIVGWLFMRRISMMGDGGRQMGFGKAKAKNMDKESRKATFEDVAGADEEKEELFEVVDFLKNPKKYNALGARIPKGVLLVGPPGTGKTLLARAVAGEADVPFFSMSGSDFVEMFVGVGASRVRDLFEQAKKNAPCIIFIDEIDAVGRRRGAGLGGGHDEREQTLNQMLVEMDGFGANEGVIVIAATNRVDILDPALTRPGRFDRQIVVGYPDVKGREEILRVHAKGKPFAPDVKLKVIARSTAGFTGADLENLVNESAILAVRRGLSAITMKEIEESTIKVVMGSEKRSKVITEEDKRHTAYHEGGHAVASYFCNTQDKVHEVSIIPRGSAGGYTLSLPEKDEEYKFKNKMLEDIVVLLGGIVAEKLIINDTSTGASSDIQRATKIARSMVTKFGMSDAIGPIVYGSNSDEVFIGRDMGHVKDYSESTAAKIDEEVKKIITQCNERTEKILTEHIDKLHEVAKVLVEKEKISGKEFEEIMAESETVTE
ncbi:MAG: ATP-dependent zinc metalloprotease FtsH [Clostridia bacterium]|nr:ATP-dependent zinc metalloprotease FtsH [Clostridia bacterium]